MDLLILIILVSGYLIGSISPSRIIGEIIIPDADLEKTTVLVEGTNEYFTFRSVSATTIRAQAGAKFGIIVSILDMAKAAIPIAVVIALFASQTYALALSLSIIIGHDFPIYYNFRGGRGVSCLIGSLIFFSWFSIPVTLILSMLIGLLVIDDAFIAYLSMPAYLIPYSLLTSGLSDFLIYAFLVNLIYWSALYPEMKEFWNFRKTEAYKKAKNARHERTRKRISKILAKLRIKRD